MENHTEKRRREEMENYIAAEKSDPFARARIITHMKNGVCGFGTDGVDAFYFADKAFETRETPLGTRYAAKTYTNRARP